MPTDTMTTKRISFQQQQQTLQNSHHHQQHHHQHHQHQQQHQRRPPDVEEALSSMLWTPYERASTTDTSSDDDDEHLQRQLKKSKSQYDYTSVPTTIPPLTPPPPPLPTSLPPLSSLGALTALPPTHFPLTPTHLTPTNFVAYITTATPVRAATAAVAATSLIGTSNAYYTAEDLCDPSVTTPLVPFSNLMLNAHTTTTVNPNSRLRNNTAITAEHDEDDEIDCDDDDDVDVDDDVNVNVDDRFNDVYNNENTLAATSSSTMMSSYQQKNRISYPSSYGRIPNLTKWWSTSNTTTAQQPVSSTAHQRSSVESTSAAAVTLLPQLPPPPATASATLTDETNKQPPSYESLYKKHSTRPLRQRQHRLNKHLNLFKPVLETLKANVTTITQGRRFTALTRPNHNRVTNTNNNNNNDNNTNAINPTTHATQEQQQPATVVSIDTTTATTSGITIRNENCSTESTSNNLAHSFTDNFLHEHCPTSQHVAATHVDNEHIINSNNNNNNNNTTTENINGETPLQQPALIHQAKHTHEPKQVDANTKSKQNQENENKQNNNFIICQQQLQKQLQNPKTYEEHGEKETSKREQVEMNTSEFTTDHAENEYTMNMQRNSTPYKTTTTTIAGGNMTAGLFYDSSSAISLTRSFEANTSYTVGLTDAYDSFQTDLQDVTRKTSATTTTTTYSLTPNKCLAELERLYAEFRASESLREQKLRKSQNQLETTVTENMRLNVPASTSNSATEIGGKSVSETRLSPSTSSVFLTTTNSVTTITNPCQRTPSLTIQVNQNNSNSNNNNPNNNNTNNNNGGGGGNFENNESKNQIILNQAIVNTTTNGVSVINCNYVNNVNNNNNKSITNLCDNATNTTTATSNNINNNVVNNLNNNHHCSPNINNISKNIQDNNSSCSSANDNDSDPTHSSVPQVLNVNNENDQEIAKNYQKHFNNSSPINTQVKVIQVNEMNTNKTSSSSSSSTPTSSPQRTFASTECQTDDISAVQLRSPSVGRPPLTSTSSGNSTNTSNNNREQRRRERRERRHLQHTASLLVTPTHSHPHPHNHALRHGHLDRHSMPAPPLPPILHPPHLHPGLAGTLQQTGHNVAMLRPMLPDILHNHFPPPYSALPPPQSMTAASGSMPHHNGSPIPFSHPHVHPHHPPPQTPTATILGPPPPPPPAGTTLLTSVISTVPIPGATPMVSDGRFTLPLPIMRRSPSERSGKGCCGQWFAGPPLRALIAVVALGGVACALGGAALGATGLAGPPSSHFTAALLMIGVGVVLVTVSGAAWRMTAPGGPPCLGLGSSVDLGRCGRRPCSRGGGAPQGLLYPEFQHRPPPPSYQASMQEYRLRLLLLDRDRQNGVVRGSSPPPTYRSHAGSLLRAPLTSTIRGTSGTHSGTRCESSIGGSEYSFPPSYRSRNTTPGTISSERSIETEPSGRLLANEDIPEPLSVEQLSEYNSLQQRCNSNNNNNTNSNGGNAQKSEQKRNSVQMDTNILISKTDTNLNNLNSDKKDDLVTIVTITPQNNNENLEASENRANNENNGIVDNESREQIEILAHL